MMNQMTSLRCQFIILNRSLNSRLSTLHKLSTLAKILLSLNVLLSLIVDTMEPCLALQLSLLGHSQLKFLYGER